MGNIKLALAMLHYPSGPSCLQGRTMTFVDDIDISMLVITVH